MPSPPALSRAFLAVSSCVIGAAAGLGSLTGGALLDLMQGFEWRLGGMALGPFHVLYLASTVLRLGSAALTRWLPDPAVETKRIRSSQRPRVATAAS